jgi:hypothetical protein
MQASSNLDAIFCELESSMCHMTSMSTRELTLIWLISVFKVVKIRASRLACPNAAWGTNRLQLTTKYGSFCWSIEVLGRIGDKSLDFFPLANRNFLERRNDLCLRVNEAPLSGGEEASSCHMHAHMVRPHGVERTRPHIVGNGFRFRFRQS